MPTFVKVNKHNAKKRSSSLSGPSEFKQAVQTTRLSPQMAQKLGRILPSSSG